MPIVLSLVLFAFILGVWLHSFGHYFFARYLLKLPSRLNLGIGFWGKSATKEQGIRLGWFPLISRYELLVRDKAKAGIHWQRLKIISTFIFGILWSFTWAFIFLALSYYTSHGVLQEYRFLEKNPPIVEKVLPGGPADEAGIKPFDKIVAVEEKTIDRFEAVQKAVQESQGPIQLRILRGAKTITIKLTPRENPGGLKMIGIVAPEPQLIFLKYSLFESVEASWETVLNITESSSSMLGGPLVLNKNFPGRKYSSYFFLFLAHVSLVLAIWNLIPLPPLDLGNALGFGLGLSFMQVRKLRFLGILAIAVLLFWKFYGAYFYLWEKV